MFRKYTHVPLNIEGDENGAKIQEDLHSFWNLKTLTISDNEKSDFEKFFELVKLNGKENGQRYTYADLKISLFILMHIKIKLKISHS